MNREASVGAEALFHGQSVVRGAISSRHVSSHELQSLVSGLSPQES